MARPSPDTERAIDLVLDRSREVKLAALFTQTRAAGLGGFVGGGRYGAVRDHRS